MVNGMIISNFDGKGDQRVKSVSGQSVLLLAETEKQVIVKGFFGTMDCKNTLMNYIVSLNVELIKNLSRKDFIRFQNELLLKLGV